MKFATKVIHAGIQPDPLTGAVMTPIYQTSTYAQESPGVHKGYAYARSQNPTREALEKNLAALENGQHGISGRPGLFLLSVPAFDIVSGFLFFGCHEHVFGGRVFYHLAH